MRGYVVGKDAQPVQFRVHDPSTGQTSMAVMVVRGGAVSMVDVLPSQFTNTPVQHAPQAGPRVGVMEGEMGATVLPENGVVAANQVQPTGPTADQLRGDGSEGQQNGETDHQQPGTEGAQGAMLRGAAAEL